VPGFDRRRALPLTALAQRRGLEFALFEYLDWWNNSRLHGEVGLRTPAEVEAQHHAQAPAATAAGSQ
jgi:transposase InsO family protein